MSRRVTTNITFFADISGTLDRFFLEKCGGLFFKQRWSIFGWRVIFENVTEKSPALFSGHLSREDRVSDYFLPKK